MRSVAEKVVDFSPGRVIGGTSLYQRAYPAQTATPPIEKRWKPNKTHRFFAKFDRECGDLDSAEILW